MGTGHAADALVDEGLYKHIVAHRYLFNHEGGVDYKQHAPATISFLPPEEVFDLWSKDFETMREYMIFGQTTDFKQMADELRILQQNINAMAYAEFINVEEPVDNRR